MIMSQLHLYLNRSINQFKVLQSMSEEVANAPTGLLIAAHSCSAAFAFSLANANASQNIILLLLDQGLMMHTGLS